MIEAIIFDCDGVLVDSEETSCAATADLLVARGFPIAHEEVRRRFLGRAIDAVFEHYRDATGGSLPPSFAEEKETLYLERARGTLRAFDGARRLLEALHGRVPIAIATSGGPRKVAFSLEETGLARFCEVVCTSAEVTGGKPAPDLFLLAAGRLGVAPHACAVVEDSLPGVEAARRAGMLAIGFTSSLSRGELLAAGADVVVDSLAEVLTIPAIAHLAPSLVG